MKVRQIKIEPAMGSLPRPCTQARREVGVFAHLCLGLGGEHRPRAGPCRKGAVQRPPSVEVESPALEDLRVAAAPGSRVSLWREPLSGSGPQEPLTGRRPWTGTVVL